MRSLVCTFVVRMQQNQGVSDIITADYISETVYEKNLFLVLNLLGIYT